MNPTRLVLRIAHHGLIACLGVLLGASIPLVEGATGPLAALLGVLAVAVAASAAAEICYGSGRNAHRAGELAIDIVPGDDRQLAQHDALTGLPNRHAFLARLQTTLEHRRRSDRKTAVLTLDLVDFKTVNAALGCAAGDLLLRHASARLLATLRETDTLARLGGDEFAVMQGDLQQAASAARLCERLLASLREPFDLYGHLTQVSARIGIAVFPADGRDPDMLLEHAGLALARAKAAGSAPFRFYEDAMDAELRERKALERDLAHALERDQLEIHYQPQIEIASRRMVGLEALLRWNHPERGRIAPDVFIPLAEDSGLIVPIGAWVLEQACAQGVRWQRAGAPTLRMAVNLSPVQFRQPDLAAAIGEALARTGLAAEHLELEITERVLMQDTEANLDTLRRIKSLGVRISIDDFGVGHSSLHYLRRFPFDEIKVDRSFIGALEHDPSAAAIVRATIGLGHSLGLVSVAEGVESANQLSMLCAEGCCLAQGFYFSPPVHPREVDAMVQAAAAAQEHEMLDQELTRAI